MTTSGNVVIPMVRSCRRVRYPMLLLTVIIALYSSPVYSDDTASKADAPTEAGEANNEAPKDIPKQKPARNSNADPDDWGSFYDPNKIFCGQYDCYKILGFDYESWGREPPSLKDITKSYRSLSRQWHPDKNKSKGAREKFVAIAKAYEVLTDSEKRAEYDHFRDRPDEYFKKYGSSVLWSYAPQSDASVIIILFLLLGSAFTYFAQKQKWQTIANHLVKAAVEDLSPREGGSSESIEIRAKALEILAKKKEDAGASEGEKSNDKKKKGPKLTAKEKREKEQNELRPICIELVNEIDDFGGGFRKPTVHDLLILKMVNWPYHLATAAVWWAKYAVRRLKNLELDDEERLVLTKNAVGEVTWAAVSDEEREEMLTLDLWITENLVEFRERQEMKQAGVSATMKKKIARMKKRGKGSMGDDFDDKFD
eukprot:CAMPEP_0171328534 /NCGR_PEP_ID=MMETSP0878-20121228/712_1 /TAXON_ID=67004 /ORGANISM="Thalassiosira weissflogii, Strain CCMP1336" /LENGTH=424 /DNA_ID=CAMNT_0011828391 /DNA_START=109 /DNA_END=1383 /DNA_ORIENTATION=+